MNQFTKLNIFLLSVVSLIACSKPSGGNPNSGGAPTNGIDPKNKEEAILKLSPAHKQNFDYWKSQVIKACDASEAFGLNKDDKLESEGVDSTVLLNNNGGSIIFSNQGQIAILTSYNSFVGIGTTKIEQRYEINGQSYTITAETKREGSSCALYLFGQKVYETHIAKSFTIGTHWLAGREVKTTSTAVPLIISIGKLGLSEIVRTGIFSLISQALQASNESIALIAQKLGIDTDTAKRHFNLNIDSSTASSIRIKDEPTAVWSNQDEGNLIAQTEILKQAFEGTAKAITYELRLTVPQFSFGDITNLADKGNYKLLFTALSAKTADSFNYSVQAVELQGLMPFNQNEAMECSKSRAQAYVGNPESSNQIQPSVQSMLNPCHTLYREVEKASFENGLMKSLVPQMFAGVTPSLRFQYGGWDQILSQLTLTSLEQDKDLRSELDPNSKTIIVGILADTLDTIKQELSRTKNMNSSKDTIFQMGLDWVFSAQVVTPPRIILILQSLDESIDTFKVSSEGVIRSLGRQANSNDDLLTFALNINNDYKSAAITALELSKELSYSDFQQDVFNQVIQKKISLEEFKDWTLKFNGIKNEIAKFANLSTVKTNLVSSSIKWLKSRETTLQDLGAIYAAIDNTIIPFEESAKDLLQSMSGSLISNTESLEFARSITMEFKQLATAIRDNSKTADFENWGQSFFKTVLQKRPTIEQLRSWHQAWLASLSFTQQEKERTKNEFGSSNDWNRKKIVETAVSELWTTEEFVALETIAEVARSKNTCEHHNGLSSLASCGGLKLFSRQKAMFFDPAYGSRYTVLGQDFAAYMNQLSHSDWTNIRWDLVREFFGSSEPIWSKCDQSSFDSKATVLKNKVNSIVKESDQIKKWELEREIKDTLRNCQY